MSFALIDINTILPQMVATFFSLAMRGRAIISVDAGFIHTPNSQPRADSWIDASLRTAIYRHFDDTISIFTTCTFTHDDDNIMRVISPSSFFYLLS